jgi:hypothetical protein
VPGVSALANGDITAKRNMVRKILIGCYRACISPNEETGRPFAADAIISNPPSFAHIHCAEAFGIPLLMSFSEEDDRALELTRSYAVDADHRIPAPAHQG